MLSCLEVTYTFEPEFLFQGFFLSCLSCLHNGDDHSPAVEIYMYLIYFIFISSTGTA